jgi:hypothetical protein
MDGNPPDSSCEDNSGASALNLSALHLSDSVTPGEPSMKVTLKGKHAGFHVNVCPDCGHHRLHHPLLTGRFHEPCVGWDGDHCSRAWRRDFGGLGEDYSDKLDVPSSNTAVSNLLVICPCL